MNKVELTKELLYDLYIIQRLDVKDILPKLGGWSKSVLYTKLKEYGINRNIIDGKAPITKEILIKEYIENRKSIRKISKELGWSSDYIRKLMKLYDIEPRGIGDTRRIQLINSKYGILNVVDYLGVKDGNTWYLCYCDCNPDITFEVMGAHLYSGAKKSCGCVKKRKRIAKYNWSGYQEISGKTWKEIIHSAEERSLEFNITLEYIWNLYIDQDRKCKFTDLELYFADGKIRGNASLDRKDSNIGYIIDNVQWVHKDINRMKQNFSDDYFCQMAILVAKKYDNNKKYTLE